MSDFGYPRWAISSVKMALDIFRAVFIAGARQCGKTTLAHQLALKDGELRTLDNSAQLKIATDDPAGFVKRCTNGPMIIDEVQKVPMLLSEIKRQLDIDKTKGQYLLTGSADISKIPAINESLAGRMGTYRLRTLVQGEIEGNKPTFLQRAFSKNFPVTLKGYTKRDVLHFAFTGGYGETLGMPARSKHLWFKSYLDALLLHDIRELMDIRAYNVLRKMMEALLAYSSKFFVESDFTSLFEIKHETFGRFLSILKMLYLLDELPAWHSGDYDGVNKRSKYFSTDTGLMASVLNWKEDEVYLDPDRSGKIVETWVYNQLASQVDLDADYVLYQYRDKNKREIDFMIESTEFGLLGIEVKAGSDVGANDFKHLEWFKMHLKEDKPFVGIVVYTGDITLPYGKDMFAVPIGDICR